MQHSQGFIKLVNEIMANVKEISPEEVQQKFSKKESFHFIDVREDNEWQAGKIPGAKHLSKGIIERDIEKTVPNKSDCIVLYCGGGYRSALAAENIQKMGYQNVYSMAGGIRLWKEKGFPEEK